MIINNFNPTKYNGKDFNEAVELSKGLEMRIVKAFLTHGFVARGNDDENRFLLPSEQLVRGLDVFCFRDGFSFFVDAKDYSRLKYYSATGIPVYLNERYKAIQKASGMKIMIFFQDHDSKTDDPVGEPYGGFMDNFIKFEKQDIPNKDGKEQIIWRCDNMKEINYFISNCLFPELFE